MVKNLKKDPIISIIVPVYNVEKYLNRCIDSILNQTFKDFELILINDGSTDRSEDICNYYAEQDNRIKVIHKENEGAAISRNCGLDIASGRYIAFVDSDDFIDEDMYEVMYKNIIKYNADIVICNYKPYDEGMDIFAHNDKFNKKLFNNIEALENYFLPYGSKNRVMQTVVWDKLIKKELFNNLRFKDVSIAEDGYITYKLLYSANKIIFIDLPLYYYRNRNDSLSKTKFSKRYLDIYDDRRDIFLFMYDRNKYLAKLSAETYINKHILTYQNISESDNLLLEDIKKYKSLIKQDFKSDIKKFKELNVDKKLILKIKIFLINYKLIYIYEKVNYLSELIRKSRFNVLENGNV